MSVRQYNDCLVNIEDSVNKDASGTGLGLYIAKEMVEAQGGKIWAESESEGSTFHVELPESLSI